MTETFSLSAEPRTSGTKAAIRAIRSQGRVPGIIYGGKGDAALVSFETKELSRLIVREGFHSQVLEVKLGGKAQRAIAREVQLHPVKDTPLHVDLLRLEKGARVRVAIPVRFINQGQSPGIKRGGVLNIVRHEVELNCPAEAIPTHITADLAELDITDSIHISAIKLPEGCRPTITGRDFTVATIAAPSIVVEVVETTAAAATPEAGAEGAAPTADGATPAAAAPEAGGKAPAAKQAGGKAPAKS